MSTLRDKLKQRRAEESLATPTPRAEIIPPNELMRREHLASVDARHPYEQCAICTENIAPRRYFLSPRKHFPICGDCLTIALRYPIKDMKLNDATHFLQTIRIVK